MPLPFLNPALFPWLALASAPIIIHLINKNRHRTIDWGAMRFLEVSVVTSARRLRLQELILLLIRTAAIAVLVLAMARPYLPGVSAGNGAENARRTMVILLDRSMSMAHGRETVPRIGQAKEHAGKLLGLLKEGDTASLVLVDHRAVPVTAEPTARFARLKAVLETVKPSEGRADFARAVDEAIRQVRLSTNPRRQVFIITDGQAQGWHGQSKATWEPARRSLLKMQPRPEVFILSMDAPKTGNLALTDVQLSRLAVGVYRPVKINARITNHSDEDRTDVNVHFLVDGKREATIATEVKAWSSATPSFEYHFKQPGSHYVAVELDKDSLELDDVRTFSVDVFQRLPVLIVNGDPTSTGFDSGVGFLALALAPKDSANPEFKDVVEPTVLGVDRLGDADLDRYHVIVLANVSSLPGVQIARIERFVEQGGGLLICPGGLCDMDSFNRMLYRDGDGLAPAKLLAPEGDHRQTEQFASVLTAAFSHQALAPFADPKQGDLSRIHAYKWFRLERAADDHRSDTLCRLDNGRAFLAEREFGRGRVILTAIPIDDDWSDLPRYGFYLPLMHHIVYYLGSGVRPARNLPLGVPITHNIEPGADAKEVRITDPRGAVRSVPVRRRGKRRTATFDDTHAAGLYKAEAEEFGKTVVTWYSVSPDADESDLRPLTEESGKLIAEALGAGMAKDWDTLYQLMVSKSQGDREVWRWFVLAVLALLALELYLTGRWSRAESRPAG